MSHKVAFDFLGSPENVIPAPNQVREQTPAGIHNYMKTLDSGIKFRNDKLPKLIFYEFLNLYEFVKNQKSPYFVTPAKAGVQ